MTSLDIGANDRIKTLSFGARIKLALLLALAWRPKVLILDEPTVGLDAISKQAVFAELLAAVQDEDRTVLISSHGLTDVERFADHLGMIKNGRMLFEGATADVIARFRMVDFVAGERRSASRTIRACSCSGRTASAGACCSICSARPWSWLRGTRRDADRRCAGHTRRALHRAGAGVTDAPVPPGSRAAHSSVDPSNDGGRPRGDLVGGGGPNATRNGIRIFHGHGVHGRPSSVESVTDTARDLVSTDFAARHLACDLAVRDGGRDTGHHVRQAARGTDAVGGSSFSFATLALSSLYDFAYTGLGCGLIIVATLPRPERGPGATYCPCSAGPPWPCCQRECSADGSGAVSLVIGCRSIGRRFTVGAGMVLAAALGLSVATYFHSSMPLTPANRTSRRPRVEARAPRLTPGGLSGLPRLLVHESAWTLMAGGVLVIGSVLVVVVAAKYLQSPESLLGLLRSVLLHVDGTPAPGPGTGLQAFILLIIFAVFAASLAARFPDMLRHLRVLPLGAARLNVLLLVWPAVVWLTGWTGLLALHYLVMGRGVVSYHVDALFGLIGISAIVQAMTCDCSRLPQGSRSPSPSRSIRVHARSCSPSAARPDRPRPVAAIGASPASPAR